MMFSIRLLGVALALFGSLLLVCPAGASSPIPAPVNFKASVKTGGSGPLVDLTWSPVPSASSYVVFRDGHLYSRPTSTSFADTNVQFGQKHTYTVCAFQLLAGWWSYRFGTPTSLTMTVTPPAPSGVKANGLWIADCPKCHIAMAHIVLTWNAVAGAQSYSVYRGGTLLCTTQTPADTDMVVTSGKTYSYTVQAASQGVTGPLSIPVTATAAYPPASAPASPPTTPAPSNPPAPTPGPPSKTPAPAPVPSPTPGTTMDAGFTAPANLQNRSAFIGGVGVDTLVWDPVPGADSYNVYAYNTKIASNVIGTTYAASGIKGQGGITYTVTAVDTGCNCETIPSAPVLSGGSVDPANVPSWVTNTMPPVPTSLVGVAEWNGGKQRNRLYWQGAGAADAYRVYRDGVKVADGLFGLTYYDNNVQPGETHSYSVSNVNTIWPGTVESAHCVPVSVTALTAAPAALGTPIPIDHVVSNDDSVKVFFPVVPGAVDYCIYDVSNPGMKKYFGWYGSGLRSNTSPLSPPTMANIEWNGIIPSSGATLVVEAVDKLGPFQTMDGTNGPGSMAMDGSMSLAINGQGDPSNLPNVIASSAPFHVACKPFTLAGQQVFMDNFQNNSPLVASNLPPALQAAWNSTFTLSQQENDKWVIRSYGLDDYTSRAFFMNNHFMDTIYDGPFAAHNNNGSLVMMPKATADISGGKVLHVTLEVDAHFDDRRWVDVFVAPSGDDLLQSAPTKLEGDQLPTTSGNLFYWQLSDHQVHLIQPVPNAAVAPLWTNTDMYQAASYSDLTSMERDALAYGKVTNDYAAGSPQHLDNRSRFDLYLSQNHYRIIETFPDGVSQLIRDKDFPAGMTLPFTHCQVYFAHELYHTNNERGEALQYANGDASYYTNLRPYADERHWDNMAEEVLPSFPAQ